MKGGIEDNHTTKNWNKKDANLSRTGEKCSKCEKCSFTGSKTELEKHFKLKHSRILACKHCGNSHQCSKNKKHGAKTDLHLQNKHTQSSSEPFPCEQCGLVLANFFLLQDHMNTHHTPTIMPCQYCEFAAKDTESLQNHMIEFHEEIVAFYTMAKQMEGLTNNLASLETFKTELSKTMKSLFDNQNILQQELFLIRNNLNTIQTKPATKGKETLNDEKSQSTSKTPMSVPTSTPKDSPSSLPKAQSPSSTPQAAEPGQVDSPKILYIGDSISSNVNISALENATQSEFVKAKAYSSIYNTESNSSKQAPKFPKSNFTDVIPTELKKEKYQYLVLQAGSVEITNLNTNNDPENNIEYFRQETINSAKHLFNAATNALKAKPSLRKVVIMKHIPRYDPSSVDPLSLKPALSLLFNNTLSSQWMESPDTQ